MPERPAKDPAKHEHRARRDAERTARHERRHASRADRRQELLEAAIAGIRKHGPAASMDQLAAEAGITKPILYRHFGDRTGLVNAVAEQFGEALQTRLQAALTQIGASERELLVNTIDAFVGSVESDPALYRFVARNYSNVGTTEHVDNFLEDVSHSVALIMGERARALGRDSGGVEVIAYGIVTFVDAAGDWWVNRRTMSRQQLVTYIADFLWSGFEGLGATS